MSDFSGLYQIRDGNTNDLNFILSTFLRGLYYGDSWFSSIPKDIFMANYKVMAATILAKSIVKVAYLPEDPNIILGYSILSADYQTAHFVYVKKMWRNKGIAKSLVPKHPMYVSHLTELGRTLMAKLPGAVFNPFAI